MLPATQLPELATLIREATADVEQSLSLEDEGWIRVGGIGEDVIPDADRRTFVKRARRYYTYDPLARQAIRLWTDYSFGAGMTWQSEEESITKVLEGFWGDRMNQTVLSAQGQRKSSDRLLVDGEVFLAVFLASGGKATIRRIDPLEITEIVTDPDDFENIRLYKREWVDRQGGNKAGIYRSILNPKGESAQDSLGATVSPTEDALVYHVAYNTIGQRGNSILIPALSWIYEYRRFLASRVAIMLALARFAWKTKLTGGQAAVDAVKAVVDGQYPQAASHWVENQGATLEPIKADTGARNAYDDGRMLKLQVCAAVGIPEQYFGDIACSSEDTEVLTEQGWILHQDWRAGNKVASYNPNTKEIEYVDPVMLRQYEYQGDMVHFKNAQTDILVTPNHRMWTAPMVGWHLGAPRSDPSRGGRRSVSEGGIAIVNRSWRFEEASYLLANPRAHGWKFLNTTRRVGGVSGSATWARLVGYWLAEGYTLSPLTKDGEKRDRIFYRVGISQHRGATLENIRETLIGYGSAYELTNQGGIVTLEVANKGLWEYLRAECGTNSHDKRIPRDLLAADEEVRIALLETLLEGDGGYANGKQTGGWRYSSVSKQLADDVMELALGLGYATSLVLEQRDYNGEVYPIWRVAIREKRHGTYMKPDQIVTEPYSGMVYCFALPQNHIYVTRRNGKVAIQGNTGNLATAKTVELPVLKMFQSYQQVWQDVYQDIDEIVLEHNNISPKLWYVDRDFPAIAPEDAAEMAKSIQAIVMAFPDFAFSRDVQQTALLSIGVNNPGEAIAAMQKESTGDMEAQLAKALRQLREVIKGNGHRRL